jgi:hypothetical protein
MNIKALPILDYPGLCKLLNIDPQLNEWRRLVGENEKVFDALFLSSFRNYAEAVQLAPASEAHHHCAPGGLLYHTYDCISIALARRKGMQLPIGGTTKEINDKKTLWSFGVFAGCLLHDTGKLLSSIRIILNKPDGTQRWWNPHDEPLSTLAPRIKVKSYTIEFVKTQYSYHNHVAPTLIDMLPRMGRSWLANDVSLFKELCAHLRGDRFESGTIGTLAERADRESVAKNLQLPIPDVRFSQAMPLIERYLGFIRAAIQEGDFKLNRNGAIGYVDAQGFAYFVCKSLADRLIAKCDELGINDTPRDPVRIYDILQDHGYALPTPAGKAIWTIQVKGSDFTHKFTCLKFEARVLTVPTRPIAPFEGSIVALDAVAQQERLEQTAAKAAEAESGNGLSDALKAQKHQDAKAPVEPEKIPPDAEDDQAPEGKPETEVNETQEAAEGAGKIMQDAEEGPLDKTGKKSSLVFAAAKAASLRRGADEKPPETAAESVKIPSVAEGDTEIKALEAEEKPGKTPQEPEQEPEKITLDAAEVVSLGGDGIADTVLSEVGETETPVIEYTAKIAAQVTQERSQRVEKALTGVAKRPPDWQGLSIETTNLQHIFLAWLKAGITSKSIPLNNPNAIAHIVEEGVFLVCPKVFKDFLIAHGIAEIEHAKLSKRFDRMKICLSTKIGGNVFSYWAVGDSRHSKISGRVVPFSFIFDPSQAVPDKNMYLHKENPIANPAKPSVAQNGAK